MIIVITTFGAQARTMDTIGNTIWLQPPEELRNDCRQDYLAMRDNMNYEDSLTFEELTERTTELKGRINRIDYV